MSVIEGAVNGHHRTPVRGKRPRSAVTSGRQLLVDGNPNSAWSRRYHDLIVGHIHDLSAGRGANVLSDAQLCLVRRAAAIECELERFDAMLSRGEEVDMDAYARISGHLRRMWETLGLERKPRDVGPTLGELIRQDQQMQRQRLALERAQQTEPQTEAHTEAMP